MTSASERLGTGRFKDDDAETVLDQESPLVDRNLAPEAERARRMVALSCIPQLGRRACAVFLGRDDYTKIEHQLPDVMGQLHLEALPRFVRREGGQIVHAVFVPGNGDTPLNPIEHTVEVDGQARHILDTGYVFILTPEQRVVVSSHCQDSPGGVVYLIAVRAEHDAVAFFRKWQEFARQDNYLRGRAFFADGQVIERKRAYTWDDIVLPAAVRQAIETHIEGFLRNRTQLRKFGVKARRGLILTGPPGTGKTLLGKVLADTLEDTSFVWVSPRHIVDNPKAFDGILKVARFVAPTVLFFEDIDLFAEDRDARGGMALGELMNQLDGAVDNEDLIAIATTNRLEVIEKALRNRPGRFDRVLNIGMMDEGCRRRMLARLLGRAVVSDGDVACLVSSTDGYTGAQIEELTNTLYILAVKGRVDQPQEQNGDHTDNRAAGGNGQAEKDGPLSRIPIDRPLVMAALKEFQVELKARMGFHAD